MKGNYVIKLSGSFEINVPVYAKDFEDAEGEAYDTFSEYLNADNCKLEVVDMNFEAYEPEYDPEDDR